MNLNLVTADITTGLVAYYHLDDNTGTSATDSSGNGYTATLIGSPSWTASPNATFNKALFFSGSQAVNSTFSIASSFTISLWANKTSLSTYNRLISSQGGTPEFACVSITGNVNIYDTGWHDSGISCPAGFTNYIFTYDGSKTRVYLNGVYQYALSGGHALGTFQIVGDYVGMGANGWYGTIDDVAFYNRNLTDSDIAQLYTSSPFSNAPPPAPPYFYANRSSVVSPYASSMSTFNISQYNSTDQLFNTLIENNFTGTLHNDTMTLIQQNATFTDYGFNIIVGAGTYCERMIGNTTANLQNATSKICFTVSKGVLAGSSSSPTVTYPNSLTATGTETNSGDVDVVYDEWCGNVKMGESTDGNPSGSFLFGAGSQNCKLNTTGATFGNWTANSSIATSTGTINKATQTLAVNFNVTSPITYPTASSVNGTGCTFGAGFGTDVTCTLYRGNSSFSTTGNDSIHLGAGTFAYNYSSSGGANWTTASATNKTLVINQGDPTVSIASNVTSPITIGTDSGIICTEANAYDIYSGKSLTMSQYKYWDAHLDTQTGSRSANPLILYKNESLGVETYHYNCTGNTGGNGNWTSPSTSTFDLVINKANPTGSISVPMVFSGNSLNATVSWSNAGDSDVTYYVFCGNTFYGFPASYPSPQSFLFNFSTGSYQCVFNSTAGANYTTSSSIASTTGIVEGLGSCGGSVNTTTLNINIFDGDTLLPLNSTVNALFTVWNYGSDPNVNSSFAFNFNTNQSTYTLCLGGSSTVLKTNAIFDYSASGYPERFYNWVNATLTNTTYDLTLYNFGGEPVLFIVTDKDQIAQANVLITIKKFFIGTNSYQTIAQLLTDSQGRGITYLHTNSILYSFDLSRNSIVLNSYPPTIISCVDPTQLCTVSLSISTLINSEFWQYWGRIAYSCNLNSTTNVLRCTVDDPTGLMIFANLQVDQLLPLSWNTTCNSYGYSSSNTLVCDIGANATGSYRYTLSAGVSPTALNYTLESDTINLGSASLWGDTGLLLAFLMIGILSAVAIANPFASLVFSIVGTIISWALGWYNISLGAIIGLIVAMVFIGYKMRS